MVVAVGSYEGNVVYAVGPFASYTAAGDWLASLRIPEGWQWSNVSVMSREDVADPKLLGSERAYPPAIVGFHEPPAEDETTRETSADEPMRALTPEELVAVVRAEGDRLRDDRIEASDAVAVCRALDALRLELRAGTLELADIAKGIVGAVERVGFEE